MKKLLLLVVLFVGCTTKNKEPQFVKIEDTPSDWHTEQLGAKYPYLIIDDIPIKYDVNLKWYVTYRHCDGNDDRVFWLQADKTRLLMNARTGKDGKRYSLTPQGYVDTAQMGTDQEKGSFGRKNVDLKALADKKDGIERIPPK